MDGKLKVRIAQTTTAEITRARNAASNRVESIQSCTGHQDFALKAPAVRLAMLFLTVWTLSEFASPALAGALNIVRTDQAGANGGLDVNHDYTWNFVNSSSQTFSPITAVFVLKENNAQAPAVLELFSTDSSFNPTSPALYTSSLSESAGSNQYTPETFTLYTGGDTSLPNYFQLRLTSATPDNKQWFIKAPESSTFLFEDENGSPISGLSLDSQGGSAFASVPEPSLFIPSLVSLPWLLRRSLKRRTRTQVRA